MICKRQQKVAGNQNRAYRLVMKTLLP